MNKLMMFFLLTLPVGAAVADSASCYTIDNPDARSYCLARANQDSGACYAIRLDDLRAMCLAEIRR